MSKNCHKTMYTATDIYICSMYKSLYCSTNKRFNDIKTNKTKKEKKNSSAIKLKFIRDIESHWERFQHYLYIVNVCILLSITKLKAKKPNNNEKREKKILKKKNKNLNQNNISKKKVNEKGTEAEINHFSRRPGPKTIL